jgi:integrase
VHADAVNLLNQRLRESKARGFRGHLKPASFQDLVRLLHVDYEQKQRKSLKRADQCIAHLAEVFKGDHAVDITYERMGEYFEKRVAEGAARATIRQELAILGRMFTLAVRAGRLYARPSIPTVQFDNVRTGFFEDAEVELVIRHLPAYLKPLVRFLSLSGWRKSEAIGMLWADVDRNDQIVRIPGARTKNGQPRVLPFGSSLALAEVLRLQWDATQALQRESGQIIPNVFHRAGQPIGEFRRAWASACKAAGVSGRLVHDLRRSAVRRLEQAGVPRSVAMQITGHKTETVYKRYAITSAGDVSAALAKVDPGEARQEISTKSAQSGHSTSPSRRTGNA